MATNVDIHYSISFLKGHKTAIKCAINIANDHMKMQQQLILCCNMKREDVIFKETVHPQKLFLNM